jgi:hypothetical protein
VRELIEITIRQHPDDLLKFTEELKLVLDTAMNDEGHYRSRGNWHVVSGRSVFIHSTTSDRYMVYHVTQPNRVPLHVLVFYA